MKQFMFEFQRPGMVFTFIRSFEAADYSEALRMAEQHVKIKDWPLVRGCGTM